jgi:hypothetical protein
MEAYGPCIAIVVGLIGLSMNVRAIMSGENSLARVGRNRSEAARAFWAETSVLTLMSLALIILGLQILDWI